uniref:Uncharacterized protein n=1 Tax=Candidatus Methanogaster sp. ANME-2c ERB4 TaxID=2759911 RepID=A0A7G9YFD0_9EURY|nr:hypothetical protein EIOBDEGA_00002 [Methanosarcinales archaeon ANME-2c ERB4]
MGEETKSGQVAGVISIIVCILFIIFAANSGWNMAGQVMGAIGLIFGILGFGSFWKPETIGQITSQILENIARNAEEQNSQTRQQNQNHPNNSPQAYTEDGDVTINQEIHVHEPQGRKKRY